MFDLKPFQILPRLCETEFVYNADYKRKDYFSKSRSLLFSTPHKKLREANEWIPSLYHSHLILEAIELKRIRLLYFYGERQNWAGRAGNNERDKGSAVVVSPGRPYG